MDHFLIQAANLAAQVRRHQERLQPVADDIAEIARRRIVRELRTLCDRQDDLRRREAINMAIFKVQCWK